MKLSALALFPCLLLCSAARAADYDDLITALNAVRGQDAACAGKNTPAAQPLAFNPLLAQAAATVPAEGATGDLNTVLDRAGYRSRRSFMLRMTGLADAAALARYAGRSFAPCCVRRKSAKSASISKGRETVP